jgi:STE24 endopeptidase
MGIIYPDVVAPLFNKFEELPPTQLRTKILQLSEKVNFPLTKIFVMDGSRRSHHSNAYLFGIWKNKRIVLYDTLLLKLNDDEVVSVVAHEIGHWKYRHA